MELFFIIKQETTKGYPTERVSMIKKTVIKIFAILLMATFIFIVWKYIPYGEKAIQTQESSTNDITNVVAQRNNYDNVEEPMKIDIYNNPPMSENSNQFEESDDTDQVLETENELSEEDAFNLEREIRVERERIIHAANNWDLTEIDAIFNEYDSYYSEINELTYYSFLCIDSKEYDEAQKANQEANAILVAKTEELKQINQLLEKVKADPKGDYDSDGLPNQYEIQAFYGTFNPLDADTYDEGILDGDSDPDSDGLTNKEEMAYGTNPVIWDTDEDEISDKRELELGYDPLTANTLENSSYVEQQFKSEETGVIINIHASGDAENSIDVVEQEEFYFNSPHAITPLYNITTEVSFDRAEICIPVDLSQIPKEDYDKLWVVYFDEESQGFIPLENTVVNSKEGYVSAVITRFSIYSVFYVSS